MFFCPGDIPQSPVPDQPVPAFAFVWPHWLIICCLTCCFDQVLLIETSSWTRKQCINSTYVQKHPVRSRSPELRRTSSSGSGSCRARVFVLVGFQVLKCSLWRLYWRSSAPGENSWEQLIQSWTRSSSSRDERSGRWSLMFVWFSWNLNFWH